MGNEAYIGYLNLTLPLHDCPYGLGCMQLPLRPKWTEEQSRQLLVRFWLLAAIHHAILLIVFSSVLTID